MPDICGYADRWADTWYYPRSYASLSPLEKWAGREPTRGDKKKYEERLKQERNRKKKAEARREGQAKCIDKIVFVSWEESERGWGTRPDGCSLHLTKEDYYKFLKIYWTGMPKEVPDEYSRPAGEPSEAFANPDLYGRIKRKKYGLRLYRDEQRKIEKKNEIRYGKNRTGWVPIK